MVPPPRPGTFSPNPGAQPIYTGISSHSPHNSHAGALSAAASPSTSSPTGSNSLTKIAVAQVYLLLSTIKEDKDDPRKWESQIESLRKLLDEHGMDVFTRYFARLVAANASQIFPGPNRPVANPGNYHLLVAEMRKLSRDFSQARKIAESIETGTEDIFRDFDLSTFMEHFQLDALEKTLLALAFKLGLRADLKARADAILSTNFPSFVNILSRPTGDHADLEPDFVAELLDRFIQCHPPNFNAAAKRELEHKVQSRYAQSPDSKPPPSQVLAALDLVRMLADKPPNALALYIHRTGAAFTSDERTCTGYLQNRPANVHLSEEQVSVALMYTTISQTPRHNPSVLVAAIRHILSDSFRWQDVVSYFDHSGARVTSAQFLRLYNALLPIAQEDSEKFNIQRLWGGEWENPETQLSFICAFASLKPEQLDATTIPDLKPTFTLEEYAQSPQPVRETAAYAVKHPLVSEAALSAVFNVALHSMHASQSLEAKRLFQDVVVPNLAIFVVSAFGVPKPWPAMAEDTLVSLFDNFLQRTPDADFVMDSLWRRDKEWVKTRLIDAHVGKPISLSLIFEHAVRQNWLEELVYLPNGFGIDLAALAHAEGYLDLQQWARKHADRSAEMARALLQFLIIKATYEMQYQRPAEGQPPVKAHTTLQVRTVHALLQILEEFLPKTPVPDLIMAQRTCITAYPRLINYGEGFDDIIDANGRDGNALPLAANAKMEEHYKMMYGDEIQVRDVVEILERYKRSRAPLDQDIFACMIHGLFDEYTHYVDYPLEALATTAVLFGGIISHKLISDLPLQIGLGMILEAVRDHHPDEPMYKFGLQALIQLFKRFPEWPGFCKQLLQIPGLQGTEAWKNAEEVVREHDEELARTRNGGHPPGILGDKLTNGNVDDGPGSEQHPPPFASVNVDPPPQGVLYEDPSEDAQDKIQFFLNNVTETTLQTIIKDIRDMLEAKHQQWFASHLVEERAKMQPNYHKVYLELVKQFEDKTLWAVVQRETYSSVSRLLNSELTLQNSTDRTYLKNLAGWLGLLTLARDKPIKHKNIAFKQLLIEAHDTKRLIIVIPFVCKVLHQGVHSNVFKPPNPWLMDIIHLLIELYHHAELKLNLKFEIEVLCKEFNLDYKAIEPSGEILNRAPVEEVGDMLGPEALENFENLSLNGMPGVGNSLAAHPAFAIPDLGPNLSIPQTEVISSAKLHEILRQALTRALQDIIQPVVDRSVTIAAISTHQMIRKDFATEPDDNRVRTAAINMVKSTAGNLALVTSKDPLRANLTNHLRSLSADLQPGLPEGIIMLCVNSNLDLASSVIEKCAEERAVPEIEDLIAPELEARQRHRLQRPSEPYIDPGLSRWAMTIPHPFKLQPSLSGLNAEQMAIYDDFARQTRANVAATAPTQGPSASDSRTIASEALADQFNAVAKLPAPAETPSIPHLGTQLQHYPQAHVGLANGRPTGINQIDSRSIAERVNKLLEQLSSTATNSSDEHFNDLPRPHPVLDIVDALTQLIITTQQSSEEFAAYAANQVAQLLFRQPEGTLLLESLVRVLETLRKIAGPVISEQIRQLFHQQPGELFLNLPLITALLGTDLLDWRNIDAATAKVLQQRKEGSIDFLERLMDLTLLNDAPLALYADFVRSLEEAWQWITEDPDVPAGARFKAKVLAPPADLPAGLTKEELSTIQLDQMDYVFDEWIHLCNNRFATERSSQIFVQQMHSRGLVSNREDFLLFTRQALDRSVERFEQCVQSGASVTEGYQAIEALVKMVMIFVKAHQDNEEKGRSTGVAFLDSILALGVLVLNSHHVKRGESFNQRVFFRFFSLILHDIADLVGHLPENDHQQIILRFAARLFDLRPMLYPGFLFGWTDLVTHRNFMPVILCLPEGAGWAPFTKLLTQLLSYLGELLKHFNVSDLAKEMYQGVLKLLVILHHDFPEYLAANHVELCQCLPPHTTQLINFILAATPAAFNKLNDPFQLGLKVDRIPEMREAPPDASFDSAGLLRDIGLLDILDQALKNGPSEDAIAQINHAISKSNGEETTFGFVPVAVNRPVIDAVVAQFAHFAVARAANKTDTPIFVAGASDIKTLHMLVSEVSPEVRYYLLNSIVNELRFPNASTNYFSHALLEIFGQDLSDPEETDIRQQIMRILLERVVGYWPQPWGLMITTLELLKNEEYRFFDLPFIKAAPEVCPPSSILVV
ncbi:CCR4-Not complex component, Not1-domain-containing protein [Chaetomium strumarium]|uniref:General negative regulator of transcription subunit 1 n=1 Tax=Chaetomium strumarium TaxID=1170767 RepID=A0AAJ0GNP7_9PEZI|nr:CCR4-Not complex component, Not1-domain-containing protein [Chaetomium strumarium]